MPIEKKEYQDLLAELVDLVEKLNIKLFLKQIVHSQFCFGILEKEF